MNRLHYVLIFLLSSISFLQAREATSIFTDRFAFKTAEEMYKVANTLPFDEKADSLINQMNEYIDESMTIESCEVWETLEQLEPYRKTSQVQTAVETWAKKSKIIKIDDSQFQSAAQYYYQKDFEKVIETSLMIIQNENPGNYTVSTSGENLIALRNNMALALMHQNKDLCAQVELEIVFQESNYQINNYQFNAAFIPVIINLTAVYERLGFSEKAKNLSQQLEGYVQKQGYIIPSAEFNATWFLDNKELTENKTLVSNAISALKESGQEKYNDEIQRLILSQNNIYKIILLIILSLVIWYFYYKIFRKNRLPFISGKTFGCLSGLAIVGIILAAANYENLAIYLFFIFITLILVITFYYIAGILVLSFLLFLSIFGGRDIGDAKFWLYMALSLIVGIIAFSVTRKRVKR